jgi:hypothetical protein
MDISEDKMIVSLLYAEIEELKQEKQQLLKVLRENDLLEELQNVKVVTPEEEICLKGIALILEKVRLKDFDRHDIANYDILHKNLRMIRNMPNETGKKQKPTDIKELLKIVEGGGNG